MDDVQKRRKKMIEEKITEVELITGMELPKGVKVCLTKTGNMGFFIKNVEDPSYAIVFFEILNTRTQNVYNGPGSEGKKRCTGTLVKR